MRSRSLLIVAVLVVASLSGCSVLLDDSRSTPTSDSVTPNGETPTATPADTSTAAPDDSASTDGTATPGDTSTATPAPDRSVSFDAAERNADHIAALEEAGSFTTESALIIRNDDSTQYINGSYAVERDGAAASTANVTYVFDNGTRDIPTTTRYTEGDTTYERLVARTDDGQEVTYRSASEPYDDDDSDLRPVNRTVAYSIGGIARDVIGDSAWNETGSGTLNGADVTRYDTSGERFGAGDAGSNAEGAATMAIDDDGVVRYIAYQFVTTDGGNRTTYTYEASFAAVGETNVQEPEWTDEA